MTIFKNHIQLRCFISSLFKIWILKIKYGHTITLLSIFSVSTIISDNLVPTDLHFMELNMGILLSYGWYWTAMHACNIQAWYGLCYFWKQPFSHKIGDHSSVTTARVLQVPQNKHNYIGIVFCKGDVSQRYTFGKIIVHLGGNLLLLRCLYYL